MKLSYFFILEMEFKNKLHDKFPVHLLHVITLFIIYMYYTDQLLTPGSQI